MSKKFRIFLIILILAVASGGFFYWRLNQLFEESEEKSQPPTLFSKEDYKIEERTDGKYIVVEKVGLTCKVPEGWKIEKEGDDIPEPEYWVNLFSSDIKFKSMKTVLEKGCKMSIRTGVAQERVKKIEVDIKFLQEYPERSRELKEDYVLGENFEITEVGGYQGFKLISLKDAIMGQTISISIPVGDEKLITLSIGFPLEYEEKCSLIWEDFLKTVVIE